ncbi:hypothetical protein [Alkanindiges hydrocarboniclasticus]|nr:hypothetical protein [Alkanindiges hydrocarboniclasticus]
MKHQPLPVQHLIEGSKGCPTLFHGSKIRVTYPDQSCKDAYLHAINNQFAMIYQVAPSFTLEREEGDAWYANRISTEFVPLALHRLELIEQKEGYFKLSNHHFLELVKRKGTSFVHLDQYISYHPYIQEMVEGLVVTVTAFGNENIYLEHDHVQLVIKDEMTILLDIDGVSKHWKSIIGSTPLDRAHFLGQYKITKCDLDNYNVTLQPIIHEDSDMTGSKPDNNTAINNQAGNFKNPLRVWWIPQFPMDEPFYVAVNTVEEGRLIMDTLAKYDIFQFENRIKPDYSNAGGLEEFEDGEWHEWQNEEGDTIDDLLRAEAGV